MYGLVMHYAWPASGLRCSSWRSVATRYRWEGVQWQLIDFSGLSSFPDSSLSAEEEEEGEAPAPPRTGLAWVPVATLDLVLVTRAGWSALQQHQITQVTVQTQTPGLRRPRSDFPRLVTMAIILNTAEVHLAPTVAPERLGNIVAATH